MGTKKHHVINYISFCPHENTRPKKENEDKDEERDTKAMTKERGVSKTRSS